MAITEFSEGKNRKQVAFFEIAPDVDAIRVFDERGYQVSACTVDDLQDKNFLQTTDSFVFFQQAEKPTKIFHDLQSYAELLLNYDCRIYVRVAKSEKLQEKARAIVVNTIIDLELPANGLSPLERKLIRYDNREREGRTLAPYIYVCDTGMEWPDIAQLILENPSGEKPNIELDIEISMLDKNAAIDRISRLLIQRAFYDCSTIHLQQISGGLSGSMTFAGHYRLAGGLLGPWPLACFVKIGTRKQIESEYLNQLGAAIYLPFHLSPRLDLRRCGLGAHDGILVGDFADESESLSSCASHGRGVSIIGNLFNKTLRAWNNTSTVESTYSLSEWLAGLLPTAMPEHRQKSVSAMGATQTCDEMRALFTSIHSKPVRIGRVHGDLHATNVLVRGTDALLIDFEKSSSQLPLIYDAAALEAGLLVDGFAADVRRIEEIHSSINPLYEPSKIIHWIDPCEPHDRSAWFYDCVKQIRMHAIHLECAHGQYAAALALALLKKSSNPHEFDPTRELTRALAYVLAERILLALTSSANKQAT